MWRTLDLLPSSLKGDPQVQAACESIDSELIDIQRQIPAVAFWANLHLQTSPLLDVLMWEYHTDWTQNLLDGTPLTDEQKRSAIDRSIVWHQKKGTKWAVEQILRTSWPTAIVTEWYQYGGRPYYFRIVLDERILNQETLDRVWDTVIAVKNVRSWLETISRPRLTEATVLVGAYQMRRKRLKLPPYDITPLKIVITRIEPDGFPA